MSVTVEALQDLRKRVLDHEAKCAAGDADPASPPYTIDELKVAIAAISKNRAALAAAKPKSKSTTTAVDLSDLL